MEGYQKLFVTNKNVTKNGGDYKGGFTIPDWYESLKKVPDTSTCQVIPITAMITSGYLFLTTTHWPSSLAMRLQIIAFHIVCVM
jgi:hypothetical protein